MLNFLRKYSQSILMWLLVGAIAFIFVVQFGPQARGCRDWGVGTPSYVAKVYGSTLTEEALRWAWIISRADTIPSDQSRALKLEEAVINGLIEREILAQAAERHGIKVTEDDVDRSILAGTVYYHASVHAPIRMTSGPISIDFTKDDGSFNYEDFKRWVQGRFQMTLAGFKEQQIREILAYRMRKVIENSVALPPGAVREEYEKRSNWIKVETTSFDPLEYARFYDPSEKEVVKWTKENAQRVESYYKENEYKYKNVEKQVRARSIVLRVDPEAEDEEKESKKALAEEIVARAQGGEDFASLAHSYSEDEETKRRGGDKGWRPRGFYEEKIEDALFSMKSGEIRGPLEIENGWMIVKNEGFREGTLPLEEVKTEIGRQLLIEEKTRSWAREDAERFLSILIEESDLDKAREKFESSLALSKGVVPTAVKKKKQEELPSDENDEEDTKGPQIPSVHSSREIRKGESYITGVGVAKELVEELLHLDPTVKVLKRVVEVGGSFHVIMVKERSKADEAEFMQQKDRILRELLEEKRMTLVEQWIDTERKKGEQRGKITIEKAYLQDRGGGEGKD